MAGAARLPVEDGPPRPSGRAQTHRDPDPALNTGARPTPSGAPISSEVVQHRAALTRRNNLLRSKGARALRIGLLWATCPAAERGRYQTALGRALRRMIDEGVERSTRVRVERDIDAVLDRRRGA